MTFSSPGAILFQLGPFTVRWYGAMFALGFIAATYFATRLAKRRGIDENGMINFMLLAFIGGVIGARLYYVALEWSHFQDHLMEIFATWNGGLSIHGGMIGAIVFGALYCRKVGLSLPKMLDICVTCVPLAQAIGRWGNFFNSELFGRPVPDNFPLKVFIPPESRGSQYQAYSYFHPTFFYESVWNLLTFLLLYFVLGERLKKYPAMTIFVYLLIYSIGRLLIEPLRTDSIMAGSIQVPMIASAISVVIALGGITFLAMRYRKQGVAPSLPGSDNQAEQAGDSITSNDTP
jgi:phosphatidylglycerol:prolipoprotein diacylglycerol transferase